MVSGSEITHKTGGKKYEKKSNSVNAGSSDGIVLIRLWSGGGE